MRTNQYKLLYIKGIFVNFLCIDALYCVTNVTNQPHNLAIVSNSVATLPEKCKDRVN